MTTYTDEQLKRALAKMLPCHVSIMRGYLRWNEGEQIRVRDTELLHLCSLVEETFDRPFDYSLKLQSELLESGLGFGSDAKNYLWHAPWQQRVIAAAKVKGVEI